MSRRSEVELTNMCLIYDDQDRILLQERPGTDGGLIFPGGHVEEGESLQQAVIREIKEETGLTIRHPVLCGVKDWIMGDGVRYLVLLYKTDEYEGELKESNEGHVFWADREEAENMNLIWNMKELLKIFESDRYSEFFFDDRTDSHPDDKNLLG